MKHLHRLLTLALLAALCLTTAAGCSPADPIDPETTVSETASEIPSETAEPVPAFDGLTIDGTYRIVISATADEITQKTADLMAAAFKEKAGLELPIVTDADAETDRELVLGTTNRVYYTADMGWSLFLGGESVYIHSNDHTRLYFATEAVLETWLTADFGLTEEGTVILPKDRVAELNELTIRLDNSITVLSQNIRCIDDPNGNSVSERASRFRQLMMEYRPDLVGTQETTSGWNKRFSTMIKYLDRYTDLGEYGMVGCSREGREATDGEWNTILYRKDRFELLDSDTTWLCDTPDEAGAVEGSLCKRICTWALLKDKQTGETILFANTHLDHSTDEVRSVQMNILMDYLADRIGQYPFYLTGDFNCRVDSVPYSTATERLSDAHKTTWVDRSTATRTYHDYKESGGSEIDFIFHNEHTVPVSYEIISKDYGGYVSDHYGVIAEFVNE